MLQLPSLPTNVQLRELRERKEREAKERIRELERQRELQRQKEVSSAAGVAAVPDERSGLDKFLDFSRDLSKDISSKMSASKIAVGFKKDSSAVSLDSSDGGVHASGWIASKEVKTVDTGEDPFLVQKDQLLAYIKQARASNRMDEVAALEQSLRDIELAMHERQPMTYGFS